MALTKIQFKPGIDKENTNYADEGGYYNCDKVRFRSGTPEKIGGWVNQTSSGSTFNGVVHSFNCWSTYDSVNLMGIGTNQKYYIENAGYYRDVTPLRTTVTLGLNPITTASGSNVVTIAATGHGATATTFITISGATAVGGITLSGEYEIVNVIDGNSYNVLAATTAGSNATGGGAAVSVAYNINAGSSSTTSVSGYGAGGYGSGGYGVGTGTVNHPIQLWSQCVSGQDLVFATSNGSIYFWLKDTSTTPARAITLAAEANTVTLTTKAATFGGITSNITVPDTLDLSPGMVIGGVNVVAGTYITTAWNGSTTVPISTPTTGASSGNYTFSYSGQAVPTQTYAVASTDINGFILALGANPYDPTNLSSTFDPMLVRWSDQNNPFQWVPATDNQSGEQRLTNGSFMITARNNRQETLLWSDTALYSMQYIGPPYVFSFQLIMDNISLISPNAAIVVNNVTYWMGKDKFYSYTGQVNTLDCSLRHFVFSDLNIGQPDQIVCGSNPGYNEVWWMYPSADSDVNDSYVIFNYHENIWYYGTINRSAWLNTALRDYPMAAFSVQTSYLNVAINSSITSITLLDATSYPQTGTITLDSEQITYTSIAGNTLLGCVRGANGSTAASHVIYSKATYYIPNQILYHEYGVDDQATGSPVAMASYLESADFDIGDGDHVAFVWRIVPDLTFEGSSATNPSVMLTVKSRMSPGSPYTSGVDTPTVTRTATYPVEQFDPQVYTRVRGRQMAFRIDSTAVGVQWQSGAMRIDIRPDGRR